jgi:hypothetical protein
LKLASLILFFNSETTILQCIDNCADKVDIIYISYSPQPWKKYNPLARNHYQNTSSLATLNKSKHLNKLKIVSGVWDNEEDQRNEVLKIAKEDQIDFLIIQDPDEFYLPEEYDKNIQGMIQNPSYPYYYNPWINFWKNLTYVALERKNLFGTESSIYSKSANFAMNLKSFPDIFFADRRQPNYSYDSALKLPGVCYHLSYVYTDEEVKTKIMTWGHSHQVRKNWFKYKWLGWKPNTKYINPMMGPVWQKATKFEGPLPKELNDFPDLQQESRELSPQEKILEKLYDLNQLRQYLLHQMKGRIAYKFKLRQFRRRK